MKKLLSCIVAVLILGACVACGHEHQWETVSNTPATCVSEGKIVKKCSCGETKTETLSIIAHDFKEISDTSTCTANGVKTSQCTVCEHSLRETVTAKGHEYYSNGKCKNCQVFKYDIGLSVELPTELKYIYGRNNHIYSKFQLTDLSFYIDTYYSDTCLFIKYSGKKTYDENGVFADQRVTCKVILKEVQTGDIVGSATLIEVGLVVGQNFRDKKENIAKISDLDTNKKYVLQILDRTI